MQFVKRQGCIFVRRLNKQLGIICIKVQFDVVGHSVTILKGMVYKDNSRGPRTEPCGTPNSNSPNRERASPILTA